MGNVEKILNSVKTVIDYDMSVNGTVFVLVKSNKGNYSIRQAFRNCYGEYNGLTVVKLMGNISEEVARLNFEDLINKIRSRG